jgi:hypothetical protein
MLCLNLINVVIILGRSLRVRRAVAVQRVHAARQFDQLEIRVTSCQMIAYLYDPFADMPTACLPVSVVSRKSRSFSLKISSPCELAAFVMRSIGPQRLSV